MPHSAARCAEYRPAAYIVAGPTASGKSGLAAAMAERLGGCVINADSMQVYRDLRILTARPGAELLAKAPHHLFGIMGATEICSVARWVRLAMDQIALRRAEGAVTVLCGGTGLYLTSLLGGIAPVPDIPAAVRASSRALHAEIGGPAFRARLALLDPEGARSLHQNDSQRLMRAYEVVTATGITLREWQLRAAALSPLRDLAIRTVVLAPPREVLYRLIDSRFARMVEAGAVEEVKQLLALQLDPALPIMKALGVASLAGCLRGEWDLPQAIVHAQQASRRYAKRQMTWFRHHLADAVVINEQYSETNEAYFCQKIFDMA